MTIKLPASTQNQLGASLPDEDTWAPEEQKLLEESIRKHPASDPDRWDKVSLIIANILINLVSSNMCIVLDFN